MSTTTKLTEALDALVGAALTKHHDSTSDTLFTLCHVCNRWDEHAPTCPIPAIQHWLGDALACPHCSAVRTAAPIAECFSAEASTACPRHAAIAVRDDLIHLTRRSPPTVF